MIRAINHALVQANPQLTVSIISPDLFAERARIGASRRRRCLIHTDHRFNAPNRGYDESLRRASAVIRKRVYGPRGRLA